jgi:hypothetical protein
VMVQKNVRQVVCTRPFRPQMAVRIDHLDFSQRFLHDLSMVCH